MDDADDLPLEFLSEAGVVVGAGADVFLGEGVGRVGLEEGEVGRRSFLDGGGR